MVYNHSLNHCHNNSNMRNNHKRNRKLLTRNCKLRTA